MQTGKKEEETPILFSDGILSSPSLTVRPLCGAWCSTNASASIFFQWVFKTMGITLKARQSQAWGILSMADENQICCLLNVLIWQLNFLKDRAGLEMVTSSPWSFPKVQQSRWGCKLHLAHILTSRQKLLVLKSTEMQWKSLLPAHWGKFDGAPCMLHSRWWQAPSHIPPWVFQNRNGQEVSVWGR